MGLTGMAVIPYPWQTGSELNPVGFNLSRKVGKGEWVKLNPDLIAAKHMGEALGDAYSRQDKKVKADTPISTRSNSCMRTERAGGATSAASPFHK